MKKGFTLIEVVVGSAVFLIVALAAYGAYVGLFKLIDLNQYRILATNLANEQFEIARNMPYSDVGVQGSIPNGKIPHVQTLTRGGVSFTVTTTVRNIDLAFDGTIGGSPNDLSPADNKLVEVNIACTGDCRGMKPITLSGQVAPKNLETASTNGALFIRVFDANGLPVQNASVHVVNVATTTTIVIDDVTDANGMLQLVDVPPSANAYRITVTKSGYSTERTYPQGASGNPNPAKPDATVLLQQVTQVSFAIDRVGTLNFGSVTPMCVPVGNFDFSLKGGKILGPSVPKYSQNLSTNSSGLLTLNNIEWDTYTSSPPPSASGGGGDVSHDLAGQNPLNPATLNPNATQNIQLVVVPHNPLSVMITVKDSTTGLPITDATVTLVMAGYNESHISGKGYLSQTDWSGGGGQVMFVDATRYNVDDNNVDVTANPGDIRLKNSSGSYNPSGLLESSIFDTGSPSNFYNLSWSPSGQPPLAGINSVQFQLASVATITPTTTWAYKGPDGTSGSYYSISDTPINSGHSNDEFLRYRAYLSTQTATVTPNISDVAFTFTSSCTPPGQVIFTGLDSGLYTLTVSKSGYTTYEQELSVSANWAEVVVILGP